MHVAFDVEIGQARQVHRLPRVVLGLLPFWLFLGHRMVGPTARDPFVAEPPEVAGLPIGVIALGLAFGLMALGIAALLRFGSMRAAIITLVLVTLPAVPLVVVTPGLILELMRLNG